MLRRFATTLALVCLVGCTPQGIARVQETLAYSAGHPNAALVWFDVDSASMAPTLQPGDAVLADSRAYGKAKPERGDLVIFTAPIRSNDFFLRRIIGLPCDHLSITAGKLYLNGRLQREPYIAGAINYDLKIDGYRMFSYYPDEKQRTLLDPKVFRNPPRSTWTSADRVPNGYYVLLGDNRNDSDDSHIFGFITRKAILAKVVKVL